MKQLPCLHIIIFGIRLPVPKPSARKNLKFLLFQLHSLQQGSTVLAAPPGHFSQEWTNRGLAISSMNAGFFLFLSVDSMFFFLRHCNIQNSHHGPPFRAAAQTLGDSTSRAPQPKTAV
jgi:hypothetical protein